MTTKGLWILINAIPIVLGASLITTTSVRASDQVDNPLQTSASDPVVPEGIPATSPVENQVGRGSTDESDLAVDGASAPPLKFDLALEKPALLADTHLTDEPTDPIEQPDPAAEPTHDTVEPIEPIESIEPIEEAPEAIPDELDTESADTDPSPRWRFTFEPYVYIPLHVEGEVGINSFENRFGEDTDLDDVGRVIDIDIDTDVSEVIDTVRDSSFFGFMGRTEAWRNRFGLVFDASYLSLQQSNTTSLDVPDPLGNLVPSEIEVDTHFSYGQFDLGVGHRFANGNLTEAETDFDLGPVVFDVVGGLRLYTVSSGIEIDTNLGRREQEFDEDTTFVTPLLSGRLRWNMSRNVALSLRGDIAGFGIGGLDLAWSATTGLDWMFSGNTSIFLGYRVSSFDYSSDGGDRDLDIDLLLHGPYLGMVFRF